MREEKIIVSLTSFPERINQVNQVLQSILNQTLKPDLIILTLSLDEFPNKEIPNELLKLESSGKLKIKWVEGNEYSYKKLMHTLKDYPEDLIITMDDDVIYEPHIIEILVKEYYDNGENNPISGSTFQWKWCHNCYSHHGSFSLTSYKFFDNYIFELYEKYIIPLLKTIPEKIFFDDTFYTLCAGLNGYLYKASENFRPLKKQGQLPVNFKISNKGTIEYKYNYKWFIDYVIKIIQNEYGKNVIDEIGRISSR